MKKRIKHIKIRGMNENSHVLLLLKSAYEKSGKTHKEIAEEINATQPYISKTFSGRQYASLAMLIKIGHVVGLETKQITTAWKKDKISEIDAEIAKFN